MNIRPINFAFAIFMLIGLAACGGNSNSGGNNGSPGGNGGGDNTQPSAPTISSQPGSITVNEGQPASFSVTATTGTPPLTYQWRKNGVNISGATSAQYATDATVFSRDNGARFSVVVSNAANKSVTSIDAVLTVTSQSEPPVASTNHPRLWIRPSDVERLRGWAVPNNPIWKDGLLPLAEEAKTQMDNGIGDAGGATDSENISENYARLFAFMSLVHPVESERADYASRARTLLMNVINAAANGVANGQPFCDTAFSVSDRSRWYGEGFGLTVDWIYPTLTTADKAKIRTVFLRWASENIGENAYIHPQPIGKMNDPVLLAQPDVSLDNEDQDNVRWANNNYYNAHMRNIGLMAMSLDDADDQGLQLRNYLNEATGAYLYILNEMWKTKTKGGLLAEGFEYAPQSMAYETQFLWALKTSGYDNTDTYGPQVKWDHAFWNDVIPAYLHSLSPATTVQEEWVGPVYLPAWYGAAQHYYAPDMIPAFAPLALRAVDDGNVDTAQAYRWIETYTPPGEKDLLLENRVRKGGFLQAILYFMLMDPSPAKQVTDADDPHKNLGLQWMAEGIGRLLARTDWTPNASFFNFTSGWKLIDHQTGDGLNFELYRKGEWLTRHRIGYDQDYALVDNHNSLAIHQNTTPAHPDGYRGDIWTRGSQNQLSPAAQAQILNWSAGADYVYALGDATGLYNSYHENVHEVTQASRSIVWLKPDHIVVYDRAATTTTGSFKKFWLQLPAIAAVSDKQATVNTPGGQKLFVTNLLPANATLTSAVNPNEASGAPADGETMTHRLLVEGPNNPTPAAVQFLHVIQGADSGTASASTLVKSTSGDSYEGATVAGNTVMFPVNISAAFTTTTYTVANGTRQLVTGLTPGGTYSVSITVNGANRTISITPSGSSTADSGGVLVIE